MFDNDAFDWEEICEEDGCDPADEYWEDEEEVFANGPEFDWIEYEFLGTDNTYESDLCDFDEEDNEYDGYERGNGSYWQVTAPFTERQCEFSSIPYPCSFRVRISEEETDLLDVMRRYLDEYTNGEGYEMLSNLPWQDVYGYYQSPEMYIRIEKLREAMERDKRDEHEIILATKYSWSEPDKDMQKKELQRYGI